MPLPRAFPTVVAIVVAIVVPAAAQVNSTCGDCTLEYTFDGPTSTLRAFASCAGDKCFEFPDGYANNNCVSAGGYRQGGVSVFISTAGTATFTTCSAATLCDGATSDCAVTYYKWLDSNAAAPGVPVQNASLDESGNPLVEFNNAWDGAEIVWTVINHTADVQEVYWAGTPIFPAIVGPGATVQMSFATSIAYASISQGVHINLNSFGETQLPVTTFRPPPFPTPVHSRTWGAVKALLGSE